ncbi:Light-inducible protein CPRF2 [Platanthera zijinensis]|uniref:Light-inducible protein CPRF2 n=1 Tax=Platanthera zijinensis TaxID=2320716 RepID=A0AAP0C1D8_9ASPA
MDCSAADFDVGPTGSLRDDRRIRRMISNRESARRSRMRKQRHLEDLRSRVSRLRLENCSLADRIASVSGSCIFIRRENEKLRSEFSSLRQRISQIHRVLFLRQLERLSSPPVSSVVPAAAGSADTTFTENEQIPASLMT